MELELKPQLSFQEKYLPKNTELIGLSAIVQSFGVQAPLRKPCSVSEQYVRGNIREEDSWRVYDKRYHPENKFSAHLTFALKHEEIDLLVLKRIFQTIPHEEMEALVKESPTGGTARRAWFLYEFLTGKTLKVPDAATNISAVDLLDPKLYFVSNGQISKRHRVRNNLLGNSSFCPVIRRTKVLEDFVNLGLSNQAKETISCVSGRLVARATSFLLLADSRASFEIEGERPARNRLEQWGRAITQAGKDPLTVDEIIRLHSLLIEDNRFVKAGLRSDAVFIGERDHLNDPFPEFIGARPEDLEKLMAGLVYANNQMRDSEIDPVLQAASIAFGFVYIHPLQDGNGRLHRCLIHHVLAERNFTPTGMVFPVSYVMFDRIDDYRMVLQEHSRPLMEFIDWRPTPSRNVEVLNDTMDLYSFFDCTKEAEFLYSCVQRTVENDMPREIDYLKRHDQAIRRIKDTVEMPDRLAEDFIMFVRQNSGTLPKKRRNQEFVALTDREVNLLEEIINEDFDGF